jgi:hypothetical protein
MVKHAHLEGMSSNTVTLKTEIDICCFSTKHAALRRKSKDWLIRNVDNVSSATTCLPANCRFSEQAI